MAANAPDRESQLDEVIAAYLEAAESGQAPDRREWLARYPELADELTAFFADEERFGSLVAPLRTPAPDSGPRTLPLLRTPVPDTPQTSNGFAAGSGEPGPGAFGDYELLEEVARGGMGIVFKARQKSLNRLVALKMIRGGHLASAEEVQRFRLEAEAAANLDHPHIVPIYEVGEEQGRHFFTMRLVEGGSLAQRLRGQGVKTRGKQAQREAARLVAVVARAVHHAHQHGILHRDLKPGNILLDSAGQPYVTDFGLAKRFAGAPPEGGEKPLTESGLAVGTPNYMAPEQAAGPRQALTTAADVYSLGAILYELLVGRPPFRAETPLETLMAVLHKEPERPRLRAPSVPRDLETICLKCLDKDPARRYASAAALADDLEHFLAHEPILARPVGAGERLWRWCRRNPSLASVSALAGLALVATTVITLVLAVREADHVTDLRREEAALRKAKEQTEEALHQANKSAREAGEQRRLAEGRFDRMRQAVGDLCLRLGEEKLNHFPRMQKVRKELLEAGARYFEELLKQKGDDPRLGRERADTLFRLAHITSELGASSRARVHYQRARDAYEDLVRTAPEDLDVRAGLARTCVNLGLHQQAEGQMGEAEACLTRARDLYAGLRRARPKALKFQSGLIKAWTNLGIVYRATGRLPASLDAFQQALVLSQDLVRKEPGNSDYQSNLAVGHINVGVMHLVLGRNREAGDSYQKALAIQLRLHEQRPSDAGLHRDLALTQLRLGRRLCADGKPAEGLKLLRQGNDLFRQLVRVDPEVVEYQDGLAGSYFDLGYGLEKNHQPDQALESYQKACALREALLRKHPDAWPVPRELGSDYHNLGVFQKQRGQTAAALRSQVRARAIQESLVARSPGDLNDRTELGGTLQSLALLLFETNRPEAALAVVRQAIDQRERVAAGNPHVIQNGRDLARSLTLLARIEARRGRPAASLRALQAERAFLLRFAARHPRDLWLQCDLADNLAEQARAHRAAKRLAAAAACLQKARDIRVWLLQEIPTEPFYHDHLAAIYFNLAEVHARLGHKGEELRYYQKAERVLDKLVRMYPRPEGFRQNLYMSLRNQALCFLDLNRSAEAVDPLRRAVTGQRALMKDFPTKPGHRKILSGHYRVLVRALRTAGRREEAAAALRECRDLYPADPGELFQTACDFAALARAVAPGRARPTPVELAERRRYSDEALEALRLSIEHGFKDAGRLGKSPELAGLRERPEFRELLARLKKRS